MTELERKRKKLMKQIEKLHERKAEGLGAEPELSQAYDELMRIESLITMGLKRESDIHKTTLLIGKLDERCEDCPLVNWCANLYEGPQLCRIDSLKDVETSRYIEMAGHITEAEVEEKISQYDECGSVCWMDVRLGAICDIVLEKIYNREKQK